MERVEAYLFIGALLIMFCGSGMIGGYIGNKTYFPEKAETWHLWTGIFLAVAGVIGMVEMTLAI